MCGLAIATPFYDHVRMYEISNLGCVGSPKKRIDKIQLMS